jgi:hypothetical protein
MPGRTPAAESDTAKERQTTTTAAVGCHSEQQVMLLVTALAEVHPSIPCKQLLD